MNKNKKSYGTHYIVHNAEKDARVSKMQTSEQPYTLENTQEEIAVGQACSMRKMQNPVQENLYNFQEWKQSP